MNTALCTLPQSFYQQDSHAGTKAPNEEEYDRFCEGVREVLEMDYVILPEQPWAWTVEPRQWNRLLSREAKALQSPKLIAATPCGRFTSYLQLSWLSNEIELLLECDPLLLVGFTVTASVLDARQTVATSDADETPRALVTKKLNTTKAEPETIYLCSVNPVFFRCDNPPHFAIKFNFMS